MQKQSTIIQPAARVFSLQELPGWLGKTMDVPPGKQGILLDAAGKVKLLPPGKTIILTGLDRLASKGVGLRAGCVPAEEFELNARYENLLCGDEELLDASLLLRLKVSDPALFFKTTVLPIGEVRELPDLGRDSIRDRIEKTISHYEREDILRRIPTGRLADEISREISDSFPAMGLELTDIPLLLFRRPEDRLLVAGKMAELGGALEEMHRDSGERDADMSAAMEETAGRVLPESMGLRARGKKSIADVLNSLRGFQQVENSPRQHWRLAALRAAHPDDLDRETAKALDKWRVLEILWISFLLITGVVVTYTLLSLDLDLKSPEVIGFLVGIWGVVITSIIASVKKLVEKKEALLLKTTNLQNIEKNQVTFGDRKQVDSLVRQHCLNEARRAGEILFESRGAVYSSGKTDLAGKMKEFEQEIEGWKGKVQNPAYAAPYYLSAPSISQAEWTRLLDQEEAILALSRNLGKTVEELRAAGPAAGLEDLEKIRQKLYALESAFFDRSRLN